MRLFKVPETVSYPSGLIIRARNIKEAKKILNNKYGIVSVFPKLIDCDKLLTKFVITKVGEYIERLKEFKEEGGENGLRKRIQRNKRINKRALFLLRKGKMPDLQETY